MRLTKLILILMLFFNGLMAQNTSVKSLFCYGDIVPAQVTGFDYVVLESAWFTSEEVLFLKKENKNVLAYISLGEVSETAAFYATISSETLGKNTIWDSHVLDIEAKKTQEVLLQEIEKIVVNKRFDGLFIDNIDNYTIYGPTPQKKEALISFLKALKTLYPELKVMQNAGLEVLEETHHFIDAVAVESIASNYDFDKNNYRLRDKKTFKSRLNLVKSNAKAYQLPIIAIEYANSTVLKTKIEKRLKTSKLSLFIGQIDLQKIPNWYFK